MAAPSPTWAEHIDLVQVVIAGLLCYLIFTLRELVNWFKESIADLYDKYNRLSDEFNELKGEHNARNRRGNHEEEAW